MTIALDNRDAVRFARTNKLIPPDSDAIWQYKLSNAMGAIFAAIIRMQGGTTLYFANTINFD